MAKFIAYFGNNSSAPAKKLEIICILLHFKNIMGKKQKKCFGQRKHKDKNIKSNIKGI